jgi:hypothetical protein
VYFSPSNPLASPPKELSPLVNNSLSPVNSGLSFLVGSGEVSDIVASKQVFCSTNAVSILPV